MLVLLIAMPPASAVSAIAAAVPVELLIRSAAVLTASVAATITPAITAIVTMMVAVAAVMLRAVIVLSVLTVLRRRSLLAILLAWLSGCFGGRWWRWRRRWCRGRFLSGGDAPSRRRSVVGFAAIVRSFRRPVEVRVWLASGFGGRTAGRARPSAATLRASAFGHAAVFVMGCVLTMALGQRVRAASRCSWLIKRSHVTATRAHQGHELMHVGCGLACCLETGFGIVRASHERFCRRTSADYTRGQATFPSFSVRLRGRKSQAF
jgi:hypothetical protein